MEPSPRPKSENAFAAVLLFAYALSFVAIAAASYLLLHFMGRNGDLTASLPFLVLQSFSVLIYLAVVAVSGKWGLPRRRSMLAFGGLAGLAAVIAYPFQSLDVLYYIASVVMAKVYALNPFTATVSQALQSHPRDPLLGLVFAYNYGSARFPYGYTFYGYLQNLWTLTLGNPIALLYLHKAVMFLVAIACGLAASQLDKALGADSGRKPLGQRWWLLVVSLNPLVLLGCVADGHNDVVLALLVLLVFLLLTKRRPAWAVAIFIVALQWKVSVALLVPFLLVWAIREGVRPLRRIVAYVAAIAASFVPYYLFLGIRGVPWLAFNGATSNLGAVLRQVPLVFEAYSKTAAVTAWSGIFWVGSHLWWPTFVALVAMYAWKAKPGVANLMVWSAWAYILFLLVFTTYLLPWYFVWLLPFLPVLSWERQKLYVWVFTSVSMLELVVRFRGYI